MKAIGKAKRIGFSYHDGPVLLDEILSAHPEVDVVQLQINYLDWESVGIEADVYKRQSLQESSRQISHPG